MTACEHGNFGRCYECRPRTLEEEVFSADRVTAGPTVDGLIALLRQAEWAGGDDTHGWCAWDCGGTESTGHLPTCPVAPILYPKES